MRIVLVIAAHRRDFENWIDDNVPRDHVRQRHNGDIIVGDAIYKRISDPLQMRGYHGVEVVITDHAWDVQEMSRFADLVTLARLP
jgi:hypothetical protein